MSSKADLHIHSRFSDRSAEWILRRLDFPDSYSDPRALYDLLRARGMDFVTITDHNRIDGALEIAHLPGAFIGEQVTAYFPEDRTQVHLLVWDIDENRHREIQALRENIYELQAFLSEKEIAHAVAHPLYKLDENFGAAHFEKLILLFKCFEGINGLRNGLLGEAARFVFENLTREKIEELANRHGRAPTHAEPWKKILVAGSDDHGGRFPASAFTETKTCTTPQEFLRLVVHGDCEIHGIGGTPLTVSHSLYNTIYSFISAKFLSGDKHTASLLEKVFSRFMEGRDPTEFSFSEKMTFLAQGIASGKIFELVKPANASLWKKLADCVSEADMKTLLAREIEGVSEPERRAFIIANVFANQLAFRFFTRFVKRVSTGNIIESVQDISTLAPIFLLLSPYIYAFQSQSPSRKWLADIARKIVGEIPAQLRNEKRAWFTDTLEDVNGVATTIRRMTAAGVAQKRDLIVVTSRATIQIDDIPIKNFQPIGEFELPEYELQKLSFPPILQMIEYIQREAFTELIISTPGPIGISALLAAKMLGLRTSGIYHTDFPQYVRILTDDRFLETLAWKFMHWFYAQLDILYVNSDYYRDRWIERGIDPARIKILPRGLDIELFHPSRRDRKFWRKYKIDDAKVVLLYVGRISKEKNLDVLAAAYLKLLAKNLPVQLVLVGEGPFLEELRLTLPKTCFTGYLSGVELATAFASADIFVFPSTTDTFGNVVIEAQASCLPAIVSDQGGPRELVTHGESGLVTKSLNVEAFTEAVEQLVKDGERRRMMGKNARRSVEHRDWENAFAKFWALSAE